VKDTLVGIGAIKEIEMCRIFAAVLVFVSFVAAEADDPSIVLLQVHAEPVPAQAPHWISEKDMLAMFSGLSKPELKEKIKNQAVEIRMNPDHPGLIQYRITDKAAEAPSVQMAEVPKQGAKRNGKEEAAKVVAAWAAGTKGSMVSNQVAKQSRRNKGRSRLSLLAHKQHKQNKQHKQHKQHQRSKRTKHVLMDEPQLDEDYLDNATDYSDDLDGDYDDDADDDDDYKDAEDQAHDMQMIGEDTLPEMVRKMRGGFDQDVDQASEWEMSELQIKQNASANVQLSLLMKSAYTPSTRLNKLLAELFEEELLEELVEDDEDDDEEEDKKKTKKSTSENKTEESIYKKTKEGISQVQEMLMQQQQVDRNELQSKLAKAQTALEAQHADTEAMKADANSVVADVAALDQEIASLRIIAAGFRSQTNDLLGELKAMRGNLTLSRQFAEKSLREFAEDDEHLKILGELGDAEKTEHQKSARAADLAYLEHQDKPAFLQFGKPKSIVSLQSLGEKFDEMKKQKLLSIAQLKESFAAEYAAEEKVQSDMKDRRKKLEVARDTRISIQGSLLESVQQLDKADSMLERKVRSIKTYVKSMSSSL